MWRGYKMRLTSIRERELMLETIRIDLKNYVDSYLQFGSAFASNLEKEAIKNLYRDITTLDIMINFEDENKKI